MSDWLKKDLLNVEFAEVASIKLQVESEPLVASSRKSEDSAWESPSEKSNKLDSKQIEQILERLNPLSFSKLFKKGLELKPQVGTIDTTSMLSISLFDGRIYTLKLQNNILPNGNYLMSVRMGILQDDSGNIRSNYEEVRKEMDIFNQKANGRFFEISSWEGNEILLKDK